MKSPMRGQDDASVGLACSQSEDEILKTGSSYGYLSDEDVAVVACPRGKGLDKQQNLVFQLRQLAEKSPKVANLVKQSEGLDKRLEEIISEEEPSPVAAVLSPQQREEATAKRSFSDFAVPPSTEARQPPQQRIPVVEKTFQTVLSEESRESPPRQKIVVETYGPPCRNPAKMSMPPPRTVIPVERDTVDAADPDQNEERPSAIVAEVATKLSAHTKETVVAPKQSQQVANLGSSISSGSSALVKQVFSGESKASSKQSSKVSSTESRARSMKKKKSLPPAIDRTPQKPSSVVIPSSASHDSSRSSLQNKGSGLRIATSASSLQATESNLSKASSRSSGRGRGGMRTFGTASSNGSAESGAMPRIVLKGPPRSILAGQTPLLPSPVAANSPTTPTPVQYSTIDVMSSKSEQEEEESSVDTTELGIKAPPLRMSREASNDDSEQVDATTLQTVENRTQLPLAYSTAGLPQPMPAESDVVTTMSDDAVPLNSLDTEYCQVLARDLNIEESTMETVEDGDEGEDLEAATTGLEEETTDDSFNVAVTGPPATSPTSRSVKRDAIKLFLRKHSTKRTRQQSEANDDEEASIPDDKAVVTRKSSKKKFALFNRGAPNDNTRLGKFTKDHPEPLSTQSAGSNSASVIQQIREDTSPVVATDGKQAFFSRTTTPLKARFGKRFETHSRVSDTALENASQPTKDRKSMFKSIKRATTPLKKRLGRAQQGVQNSSLGTDVPSSSVEERITVQTKGVHSEPNSNGCSQSAEQHLDGALSARNMPSTSRDKQTAVEDDTEFPAVGENHSSREAFSKSSDHSSYPAPSKSSEGFETSVRSGGDTEEAAIAVDINESGTAGSKEPANDSQQVEKSNISDSNTGVSDTVEATEDPDDPQELERCVSLSKAHSASRRSGELHDVGLAEVQLRSRGSVKVSSIRGSHSRSQEDKYCADSDFVDTVDSQLGTSEMERSQEDQIVYIKGSPSVCDKEDEESQSHVDDSYEERVCLGGNRDENSASSVSRHASPGPVEENLEIGDTQDLKRMTLFQRLVRKSTPLRPRWPRTGRDDTAPVAGTNDAAIEIMSGRSSCQDLTCELKEAKVPSIGDAQDVEENVFGFVEVVDGVDETEVIVTYPLSDTGNESVSGGDFNNEDQESELSCILDETSAKPQRSLRKKIIRAMSPLKGRVPAAQEANVMESLSVQTETDPLDMQNVGCSARSRTSLSLDSGEDAVQDIQPHSSPKLVSGLRKSLVRAMTPSRKRSESASCDRLEKLEKPIDPEHRNETAEKLPSRFTEDDVDDAIQERFNAQVRNQAHGGFGKMMLRVISPAKIHSQQLHEVDGAPQELEEHPELHELEDAVGSEILPPARKYGFPQKLIGAISPSKERDGETTASFDAGRTDEFGAQQESSSQSQKVSEPHTPSIAGQRKSGLRQKFMRALTPSRRRFEEKAETFEDVVAQCSRDIACAEIRNVDSQRDLSPQSEQVSECMPVISQQRKLGLRQTVMSALTPSTGRFENSPQVEKSFSTKDVDGAVDLVAPSSEEFEYAEAACISSHLEFSPQSEQVAEFNIQDIRDHHKSRLRQRFMRALTPSKGRFNGKRQAKKSSNTEDIICSGVETEVKEQRDPAGSPKELEVDKTVKASNAEDINCSAVETEVEGQRDSTGSPKVDKSVNASVANNALRWKMLRAMSPVKNRFSSNQETPGPPTPPSNEPNDMGAGTMAQDVEETMAENDPSPSVVAPATSNPTPQAINGDNNCEISQCIDFPQAPSEPLGEEEARALVVEQEGVEADSVPTPQWSPEASKSLFNMVSMVSRALSPANKRREQHRDHSSVHDDDNGERMEANDVNQRGGQATPDSPVGLVMLETEEDSCRSTGAFPMLVFSRKNQGFAGLLSRAFSPVKVREENREVGPHPLRSDELRELDLVDDGFGTTDKCDHDDFIQMSTTVNEPEVKTSDSPSPNQSDGAFTEPCSSNTETSQILESTSCDAPQPWNETGHNEPSVCFPETENEAIERGLSEEKGGVTSKRTFFMLNFRRRKHQEALDDNADQSLGDSAYSEEVIQTVIGDANLSGSHVSVPEQEVDFGLGQSCDESISTDPKTTSKTLSSPKRGIFNRVKRTFSPLKAVRPNKVSAHALEPTVDSQRDPIGNTTGEEHTTEETQSKCGAEQEPSDEPLYVNQTATSEGVELPASDDTGGTSADADLATPGVVVGSKRPLFSRLSRTFSPTKSRPLRETDLVVVTEVDSSSAAFVEGKFQCGCDGLSSMKDAISKQTTASASSGVDDRYTPVNKANDSMKVSPLGVPTEANVVQTRGSSPVSTAIGSGSNRIHGSLSRVSTGVEGGTVPTPILSPESVAKSTPRHLNLVGTYVEGGVEASSVPTPVLSPESTRKFSNNLSTIDTGVEGGVEASTIPTPVLSPSSAMPSHTLSPVASEMLGVEANSVPTPIQSPVSTKSRQGDDNFASTLSPIDTSVEAGVEASSVPTPTMSPGSTKPTSTRFGLLRNFSPLKSRQKQDCNRGTSMAVVGQDYLKEEIVSDRKGTTDEKDCLELSCEELQANEAMIGSATSKDLLDTPTQEGVEVDTIPHASPSRKRSVFTTMKRAFSPLKSSRKPKVPRAPKTPVFEVGQTNTRDKADDGDVVAESIEGAASLESFPTPSPEEFEEVAKLPSNEVDVTDTSPSCDDVESVVNDSTQICADTNTEQHQLFEVHEETEKLSIFSRVAQAFSPTKQRHPLHNGNATNVATGEQSTKGVHIDISKTADDGGQEKKRLFERSNSPGRLFERSTASARLPSSYKMDQQKVAMDMMSEGVEVQTNSTKSSIGHEPNGAERATEVTDIPVEKETLENTSSSPSCVEPLSKDGASVDQGVDATPRRGDNQTSNSDSECLAGWFPCGDGSSPEALLNEPSRSLPDWTRGNNHGIQVLSDVAPPGCAGCLSPGSVKLGFSMADSGIEESCMGSDDASSVLAKDRYAVEAPSISNNEKESALATHPEASPSSQIVISTNVKEADEIGGTPRSGVSSNPKIEITASEHQRTQQKETKKKFTDRLNEKAKKYATKVKATIPSSTRGRAPPSSPVGISLPMKNTRANLPPPDHDLCSDGNACFPEWSPKTEAIVKETEEEALHMIYSVSSLTSLHFDSVAPISSRAQDVVDEAEFQVTNPCTEEATGIDQDTSTILSETRSQPLWKKALGAWPSQKKEKGIMEEESGAGEVQTQNTEDNVKVFEPFGEAGQIEDERADCLGDKASPEDVVKVFEPIDSTEESPATTANGEVGEGKEESLAPNNITSQSTLPPPPPPPPPPKEKKSKKKKKSRKTREITEKSTTPNQEAAPLETAKPQETQVEKGADQPEQDALPIEHSEIPANEGFKSAVKKSKKLKIERDSSASQRTDPDDSNLPVGNQEESLVNKEAEPTSAKTKRRSKRLKSSSKKSKKMFAAQAQQGDLSTTPVQPESVNEGATNSSTGAETSIPGESRQPVESGKSSSVAQSSAMSTTTGSRVPREQVFVNAISAEDIGRSSVSVSPKRPPRTPSQLAARRKKRIARLVGEADHDSVANSSGGGSSRGPWWRRSSSPSNQSGASKDFDHHMRVCAVSDEGVSVKTPAVEREGPPGTPTTLPKTPKNMRTDGISPAKRRATGKPPIPRPSTKSTQMPGGKSARRTEKLAKIRKEINSAPDEVSAGYGSFNDELSDAFAPKSVKRRSDWAWGW